MTQSAALANIGVPAFGIDLRNGTNASAEALATQNSGTSAPSTTYECMKWCDTSLHRDKQRNEGNTAWVVLRAYSTTAPGVGDDSADGMITGSLWFDAAGKAVYVCTDPAAGAAVWVQIEPAGEGGGGAVITGDVDKILARTSGGGASTTAGWHAASGTILQRGSARKVTAAGTVSTSWSPTLGPTVGDLITADTAGNLTLALPTGNVAPTGYRAEYQVAIHNTSAAPITVSYPSYTIEGESGPRRKITAGATQNYWIFTDNGSDATPVWKIAGTARQEVEYRISSPFTPTVSEDFLWENVYHPVLLPLDAANISVPRCVQAPDADTAFVVYRETGPSASPTRTNLLKATFASGNRYATWLMWNGSTWVSPAQSLAVEFARDDRIVITAPADLNGLEGLTWVMVGGQREYQG